MLTRSLIAVGVLLLVGCGAKSATTPGKPATAGTGGAAGLLSTCVAGLGASAPQPPKKIDRVRKPSENFRRILHPWAAPTPKPSFRKDGPMTASLAREQPLCEVLSIRNLPRST